MASVWQRIPPRKKHKAKQTSSSTFRARSRSEEDQEDQEDTIFLHQPSLPSPAHSKGQSTREEREPWGRRQREKVHSDSRLTTASHSPRPPSLPSAGNVPGSHEDLVERNIAQFETSSQSRKQTVPTLRDRSRRRVQTQDGHFNSSEFPTERSPNQGRFPGTKRKSTGTGRPEKEITGSTPRIDKRYRRDRERSVASGPDESAPDERSDEGPPPRRREWRLSKVKSSAQVEKEYDEKLKKRESKRNQDHPFPASQPPPKLFALPGELRRKRLRDIAEEDEKKDQRRKDLMKRTQSKARELDRHSRIINKTTGTEWKRDPVPKTVGDRLKSMDTIPEPERPELTEESLKQMSTQMNDHRIELGQSGASEDDERFRSLFSPSQPDDISQAEPAQELPSPQLPKKSWRDEYLPLYAELAEEDPYAKYY
ncbi:MAG: hypothetical protein M1837_001402 [Sclerophora amabilis]|nr:MAG: hypothetical protein M1837_001402 [Sclerophora amabilis]